MKRTIVSFFSQGGMNEPDIHPAFPRAVSLQPDRCGREAGANQGAPTLKRRADQVCSAAPYQQEPEAPCAQQALSLALRGFFTSL